MSVTQTTNRNSSYPLSPNPNSEFGKAQSVAFAFPRTPQSPLNAAAGMSDNRSSSLPLSKESATSAPMSIDTSVPNEDASHKRKREEQDIGDRQEKKLHVEDRELRMEDLHQDVGYIYQLCRTPHPPQQPDLSEDLFDIYNLNGVAAKVARFFPNGEKNALRKTYKGKIKELNISGRFDVAKPRDDPMAGLLGMMRMPEHEWNVNQVFGKEISRGIPQQTRSQMADAFSMNKGIIPKAMWDSSVLGDLDSMDKKAAPAAHKLGAAGMQRTSSSSSGIAKGKQAEVARPKRAIKKRGYDESSFEGYGEGFVDDDMDTGYSDDGEGGGKRRKKVGG